MRKNRALMKMVIMLNNDIEKICAHMAITRTAPSRADFDLTMMEEFGKEYAEEIRMSSNVELPSKR